MQKDTPIIGEIEKVIKREETLDKEAAAPTNPIDAFYKAALGPDTSPEAGNN